MVLKINVPTFSSHNCGHNRPNDDLICAERFHPLKNNSFKKNTYDKITGYPLLVMTSGAG